MPIKLQSLVQVFSTFPQLNPRRSHLHISDMTTANIVAMVPNAWGHIKPLLALFVHMAERRSADVLVFTLLTSAPMLPKINRELELMPGHLPKQINVIDVGASENPYLPMIGLMHVFEALWDQTPVTCKTTKKSFELPRPTVAIVDPFCDYAVPTIKKTSDGACPILAWMTAPMSSLLRLAGPESLGGYGNLAAKLDAAAEAAGKTVPEIADSVFRQVSGNIKKVAGLPDMYDYEYEPQEITLPISMALLVKDVYTFCTTCDGLLLVASSAFERQSILAGRQWLEGHGTQLFVVGLLEDVPPAAVVNKPGAEVPQHAGEDAKILQFLDDMSQQHGPRSVIFISFGTNFHPKDVTKLHAFIEELIVSGTPFLWSHASPFAKISEEIAEKISASGNGYHTNWVPQRAVLKHAATGWFVSHGGWNSCQEALSLRVPMIMWPFSADQPANAALLSITHEAAFELLSVREGDGARQPLRMEGKHTVDFTVNAVRKETREMLVKIKGAEGERVRANAEKLGRALDGSWKEGGEASRELAKFLSKFIDT